ncbi:S-adenosylmethionine:tRNA ribosyltransferase-isomerase [Salmonella enterica]|nr:S-adenosylmethionine:tRNA ribosyltransferase-isomerase [Salmonella enterica]EGB7793352.1 S-adenosylmethionine:tRNA ribosyltransferase-isomerase [Salmonella enterica]EHW9371417.1 S-adenosylmethionine:tRNA ribosyltransferase-isomerase [Salmonella enterica]EHZ4568552.1 S-adenosylmethionine:tRNA ribosyltransferase-isomerase [Salmonella enterica]EIB8443377.1 S-adenosylmethionine:tRNA ribosyltransferase-isomerase [Salmonella enterica]
MLTEKYDFRITDQMTIPLRPHWIANDSYREKCKMLVLNRSKGEIHKVEKCVEEVTINEEYYEVPQATADIINTAKQNGGRIFAVGTTVTRCLESAYSREHNCLKASSGWTALYIHPGYQLKVVDCLLTNLHQPKTTHMVLTGQFAGVDLLMKAYASEDIQSCQFDMFGDCMLIIQDEGQG